MHNPSFFRRKASDPFRLQRGGTEDDGGGGSGGRPRSSSSRRSSGTKKPSSSSSFLSLFTSLRPTNGCWSRSTVGSHRPPPAVDITSLSLPPHPSHTHTHTHTSTTTTSYPSTTYQPELRNIDQDFWKYIKCVIFTKHQSAGKAPLISMVQDISADEFLHLNYNPHQLEELVARLEAGSTKGNASSYVDLSGGVVWMSMEELKAKAQERKDKRATTTLGAGAPPAATPPPAAAAATTATGKALSPKRRRVNEDYHSNTHTHTHTHTQAIQSTVNMRKDDYLLLLQTISDEYKQKDSQAQAEIEALGARVDGTLAGLGEKSDILTQALAEVEATLETRTTARQEIGVQDERDREAVLEERMLPKVDPFEELARKRFAPIEEEEVAEMQRLMRRGDEMDVVVSGFNVDFRRKDLRTVRPSTWLNDEVINFWMQLLKVRDEEAGGEAVGRKNHYHSSFFFTKLVFESGGYDYKSVRRWTRKAGDIFTYDKVFIPVNLNNSHWCLAILWMKEKKVQYLDSMHGSGAEFLPHLKRYVADEHMDKKKVPLDMSDWELVYSDPSTTPQQGNGSDCGCFASAFAYLLSEGIPIKYVSQDDMPSFRHRLGVSILKVKMEW